MYRSPPRGGRGPRREEIARTHADRAANWRRTRGASRMENTTSSHLHVPATAIHGRARVARVLPAGRPRDAGRGRVPAGHVFQRRQLVDLCVLARYALHVGCWLRINVVHADHFVVAGEMHEQ